MRKTISSLFSLFYGHHFFKCRLRYSHLGSRNQSKRTQLALWNNTSIIVTSY